MAIHVFIDNSNVFGGALTQRGSGNLTSLWQALRVYYRNIFRDHRRR